MNTRTCCRCGKGHDRKYSKCKTCHNEYQREYCEKNKDGIKEYRKKYKDKNKEKRLACAKLYYEKNKEKIQSYQKKYRDKKKKEKLLKESPLD